MAQLAERLQSLTPELRWPVLDAGPPGIHVPKASDPTGGITIFDPMEKQLGLKLEKQKRPMPVIVIDHMEQKPTDN